MNSHETADVAEKSLLSHRDDRSNLNRARGKFVSEAASSVDTPYADSRRPEMLGFVPVNAKTVLDVGCHMGAFGHAIKQISGAEVWGVEPNPDTAAIAKRSLDHVFNNFFSPDVPIPDNYFDVVTFNDVLEHIPDPWAALKLASKKLKKGGCVVVSIPNLRHIENLLHIFKDADFRYEKDGIRDQTHLRFFTKKSACRLFDDSGLKIARIEGINEDWWRPSLVRRLVFRLFRARLEDTRFIQYAIVANKT
jgi:2-polyprenyl-3-methyl-5-hydroxy-6-metoxy-1,4-benzoquinol methylase